MPDRQQALVVPEPLSIRASRGRARVRLPEGPEAEFVIERVALLSRRVAEEFAQRPEPAQLLVAYDRSSSDGRGVLRDANVSFVGQDGHVFLRAPGLLVDTQVARQDGPSPRASALDDLTRNPFAKRSGRVARWLLLHPDRVFGVAEIAEEVGLDAATVSRVLRSLEDSGHVEDVAGVNGGRRRQLRLRSGVRLLEDWLPLWRTRRIPQQRWSIGADTADEAVALIARDLKDTDVPWAVGGLAGAARIARAVEPADVIVWVSQEAIAVLEDRLLPVASRGGPGTLRVLTAPDPWTLGLASAKDGAPVADLVQLWLDCAAGGERALEAADAIVEVAAWR